MQLYTCMSPVDWDGEVDDALEGMQMSERTDRYKEEMESEEEDC